MRYEHTPRPEIEQHYHIRDLIEGQEKRTADKNAHRNRAKEREERNSLIRDAKWVEVKPFWCATCRTDFYAREVKHVEVDWTNTTQNIAFYKTKHKTCGEWTMRLITDRHKDAYWFKSKMVRADQGKHFKDTIQPFQTGFNLLYGKQK